MIEKGVAERLCPFLFVFKVVVYSHSKLYQIRIEKCTNFASLDMFYLGIG